MPNSIKQPSSWLIALGVVLMAFGIGGFLGYVVGRAPVLRQVPPVSDRGTIDRAERHANSADYLSRRLIIGTSKLERSHR